MRGRVTGVGSREMRHMYATCEGWGETRGGEIVGRAEGMQHSVGTHLRVYRGS